MILLYLLSGKKSAKIYFLSECSWKCYHFFVYLVKRNKTTVMWELVHNRMEGNREADILPQEEAKDSFPDPEPFCTLLKTYIKAK